MSPSAQGLPLAPMATGRGLALALGVCALLLAPPAAAQAPQGSVPGELLAPRATGPVAAGPSAIGAAIASLPAPAALRRTGAGARIEPSLEASDGLLKEPPADLVPTRWRQPAPPAPWWAPVASGVLPGAGQFALRQQRSVAYAVAEAFLLVQYLAARRDGARERDAYRALAMDVARRPFGGTQVGPWEYYERLEQFLESGAFDRIPGGGLDPETDPTTFNGFRWQLARETFWRDPTVTPPLESAEYQRALDFYRRTAVGEEFRWSWRDERLAQNVYVETIRSSNRSYQRAVNMLGIVATNHLVSLIDAYVSVRIRRYGGVTLAGFAMDGLQFGYVPVPGGAAWQTGVRFAR